ncbi:hypothetical protein ACVWC8_11225, partial [Escherichia coli]
MINNISDQASSFPGTQLNQSDNFLDSLREFFAILNSSRKGELSTWDTIYLHLILAINADSDLIKNDELLAENIPSANYQFNIFFSNAFEIDVKKYLGKSEDNEVEIKVGNERITIGIRNISNGKLERQKFLFPLDYENKLQHQLDKYFTIVKKLRIGVVGLGGIAQKAWLPVLAAASDWMLQGAWSPTRAKA